MGIFTNPVVLSDGTANHSFSARSQRTEKKSMISDWVEDAATPETNSLLVVKHDMEKDVVRHLLQRKVNVHPAANTEDTVLEPITWNLTYQGSKAFSVAEVQAQLNILIDAVAEANFVRNFLNGMP